MKKFLSYILIAVVIATNLFAPFSVGYNQKDKFTPIMNKVEAAFDVGLTVIPKVTGSSIGLDVSIADDSKITAQRDGVLRGKYMDLYLDVAVLDPEGKRVDSDTKTLYSTKDTIKFFFDSKKIKSKTAYSTKVDLMMRVSTTTQTPENSVTVGDSSLIQSKTIETPTKEEGDTSETVLQETKMAGSGTGVEEQPQTDGLLDCSLGNPKGCIGSLVYYLFFKPTSIVFALAGKILDFGLMYSISDTSYRSPFVTEGWGIVRDFCNMFFIFVLLYIAFKTILGMGGAKTKEMIGNVVIVGLLINFSLFATQVIIDASNVLTRVFYNQKTIVMGTQTEKDEKGNDVVVSELGDFGEIRLSEAIVSKVDPQKLILEGEKVENIPVKGALTDEENKSKTSDGMSLGTFIIIILLSSVVNVVGTIAFLTCAFAFIGRVIGLWLAMILSPIVFFSYTVPELSNLPMIGHKKWWQETIKLAFMAPVFAFFMYIIVNFMDKGLGLVSTSLSSSTLNNSLTFLISILVPYIFIIILIMKAKSIAVSMSGTAGEIISKAGSAIGGVALGAATGGAAMAMRGTVGRLGNKIATSEWAKNKANSSNRFSRFMGNTTMKAGEAVGSRSFDVRNTGVGKMATKSMGVNAGNGIKGGYKEFQDRNLKKNISRVDSLKLSDSQAQEQNAAAKSYKDEYEKTMAQAMRDFDAKPENEGKVFSETEFKSNFVNGIRDPNTQRAMIDPETGLEKRDSRGNIILDPATGDLMRDASGNVIMEAHGEAIKNAADTDKAMYKKAAENAKTKMFSSSETKAGMIKDFKAKGKSENKKLNPVEIYKLEKKQQEANDLIEESNKELEEMNNGSMNEIAQQFNTSVEALTKDQIRTGSDNLYRQYNKNVDDYKNEVTKQKDLAKKPINDETRSILAQIANINKTVENPTNSNTERYQSEITRLTAVVNANPGSDAAVRDLNNAKKLLSDEKNIIKTTATADLSKLKDDLKTAEQSIITKANAEVTKYQDMIRDSQNKASEFKTLVKDRQNLETTIRRQKETIDDTTTKIKESNEA